MSNTRHIAVVGGGPAGLKAAETIHQLSLSSGETIQVTLYEAKRSVGRKFLIAGKSGLNITNNADFEEFTKQYQGSPMPEEIWCSLISEFDNQATRAWASELGIETFVSSGKKVFPEQMKAAPLLRRWVTKLKESGIQFKTNHKLSFITPKDSCSTDLTFETPEGSSTYSHQNVILALGGGSWPSSGSDGTWVKLLSALNIKTLPLSAANCGWEVDWPKPLVAEAEGLPIKNLTLSSENRQCQGEIVITKYGIEGGPVYKLGPQIRNSKKIILDLKPTFTKEQLLNKMESAKTNLLEEAVRRWKLHPASASILKHYHNAEHLEKTQLAELVKHCPLQCLRPRPINEAISSAGGVCWSELDTYLRLKKHPTISLAGEMINWEAPTGGFLLQGCFATSIRAAKAVFA